MSVKASFQNLCKSIKSEFNNVKSRINNVADSTACNLLNYYGWEGSKTEAGVTFTNNYDGTITVNGTASEQVSYYLVSGYALQKLLKPNTTYTLAGSPNGTSSSTYFIYGYLIASGESVIATTPKTFNSGNTTSTNINITIIIRKGQTVSNLVFKPMLEEGSVAHSFVPFTGTTGKLNSDVASLNSDIVALQAKTTDTGWKIINNLKYRISGSVVGLQGTVTPTATAMTITLGTLPIDCRPSQNLYLAQSDNDTPSRRLIINTSGVVTMLFTSSCTANKKYSYNGMFMLEK